MQIKSTNTKLFICLFSLGFVLTAMGQDTSFTYQGELKQNGNPVSDSLDMGFTLWDAGNGGVQVGDIEAIPGVNVVDGRFTVELDFGADAFTNANRWLEVVVDGTTLFPRTRITRSPYSLQTRGIFVNEDENIGIGTVNPQRQLDLESDTESTIRLTTTDKSPVTVSKIELKTVDGPGAFSPLGQIEFVDQNDDLKAFIQGTKAGSSGRIDFSATPGQPPQLFVTSSGVSASTLDVNEDINVANDINVSGDLSILGDVTGGLSILGDVFTLNDLIISDDLFVADRLGVGTTFPSAKLHIAGVPGVDGMRFPDNTLQTTAAAEIISWSTAVDPPAVQPGGSIGVLANIPGLEPGDVTIANPTALAPNVVIAYIRYWGPDEVLIHFANVGNSLQDPPSSTWHFRVFK